jgi:serine/threonine protein kinase/cytochrome c-type biogenesis protein CcmH/NrfG
MTPERWRQIDDLMQEALKRPLNERAAFLSEECKDEAARKEIESLISFHEQAESFLEVPAFEATALLLYEGKAEEMVGLLIASYKIESPLGAGGMGEVYLAEDTKLGRKVAIKLLPTYLESDELAKKRLVKEAKAAAKLSHPNICTIHEVVEEASRTFIVMQYVQGETLASRIQRTPLALRESLEIALQVADALVESHSHGIIHRDIKPQNIMIDSRAQVKVLDFGLAKVVQTGGGQSHTDSQMFASGIIVGTAAYMSPEQAKGESVLAHSDLFSLGVVLYECITGKRPFLGATAMEICARVIDRDPPPPSQLNPHVPLELDGVILKALAKDPIARYESAADMLQALRQIHARMQAEDYWSTNLLMLKLRRFTQKLLTTLRALSNRTQALAVVTFAILIVVALIFFKVLPWGRSAIYQPSPQALYWYQMGTNSVRMGAYYDATIALQKGVTLDDNSPLLHVRLAEAWIELGYANNANQEILRARSLIRDLSALPQTDRLHLQAITHMVLRDFAFAIEEYKEIIREVPSAEKAQAYVDLGRAYEKNNEIEQAIESYERASQLDPSDVAADLRLGILYGERGQNLERALEAFQKAEDKYRALKNSEGIAEVSYQRGFLFYNRDKLSEARAQLETVLEITKNTDNHYQYIRALSILSNISAAEGNATQAEQQGVQAIEAARTDGINHQVTSGFFWLGNTYLMRGDYSDAERCYIQALELAQRDNDRLNEACAQMSLGSLRTLQRNTDEGLSYLEPARLFYQQGGYRRWLSLTLTLIGRAYRNKGDYAVALATFVDLLQGGEQANDLSQMALSHEEIGSVLAIQERYPEAFAHYDKCYKINKSLNATFNFGYSAMHRANVLWQIGRFEEAKANLDEAASIATGSDSTYKHLLASIQVTNARLELSQGHYPESKAFCQQAFDLASTQYKSIAVEATYTLGLARARSGAARAGTILCEQAVKMAKETKDPQLLANALLASAETLLTNGQTKPALDAALQAQQSFARFEQQDSEWCAWLIAARAQQGGNQEATAKQYASYAQAKLSNLKQEWGSDVYKDYQDRPDIQGFLNQLGQILPPN